MHREDEKQEQQAVSFWTAAAVLRCDVNTSRIQPNAWLFAPQELQALTQLRTRVAY
jgi:hypothetical protein